MRGHHERWDGLGYPDGLAGESLSAGARLLAIADAWDAMTTPRSFRRALPRKQAVEECLRERGRQFSPDAVYALMRVLGSRGQPAAGGPGRALAPAGAVPRG